MLGAILRSILTVIVGVIVAGYAGDASANPGLRVGTGFHAFEHLGNIGHQADVAARCGVTVIYASGLGGDGYSGLPESGEWQDRLAFESDYTRKAHESGITTVLGYLCATSLVGLDTFDGHWTDAQRAEFGSSPESWLQQDIDGKPLASWYGGAYSPACMNNPGWRNYEKYMVRQQLDTGHDGIFFDNPTVHPQGCYCPHCMELFADFLDGRGVPIPDGSLTAMRSLTEARADDFRQFRCTIARDFLGAMREYARSVNPKALITANNSFNSPSALYAQCRSYAYNIYELSKTEDFIVVEDMSTQPRMTADGTTREYGPSYAQLHAINHGIPIVAVTIADADYHTPPHLVQLAMAEAAANESMYMLWSTWPEEQRDRMIASVRPYAEWQKEHADLLNGSERRLDMQVFLPFRRWIETEECAASAIAAALSEARVQYGVFCEDDMNLGQLRKSPVLVVERRDVFTPEEAAAAGAFESEGGAVIEASSQDWLDAAQCAGAPTLHMKAPPEIRAVVRDQPGRTVVHVFNLNVKRVDTFDDVVSPAFNVELDVCVSFDTIGAVRYGSPDNGGPFAAVEYEAMPDPAGLRVRTTIPLLEVSGILAVEAAR